MSVSFDDWDNHAPPQNTNLLAPTLVRSSTPSLLGSSTPASTLETVMEQSAPPSPPPVLAVTETTFPYTPEDTSPMVERSMETEFNEQLKATALEEKPPSIKISCEENINFSDPLGNIPISKKPVEIPIEFENSKEDSNLNQHKVKLETDLITKLNPLEFDSSNDAPVSNATYENPVLSDVESIGSSQPGVGVWAGNLDDGNSLWNSVDSGLHESTDRLLDARDLDSRDAMDVDGSKGQNTTMGDFGGQLRIGQAISVGDSKVGYIRYIGPAEFASGDWVGVELELPVGKFFLERM